jgi:hypothetical protein
LNNITISNLLQSTRCTTIERFLSTDLSGISPAIASRVTDTLGIEGKVPKSLSSAQVAALLQLLRDEKQIRPPVFTCLSPAGEYNMRLGVLKELKPRMVATFSDKPGSHEGHPFLVEAAVSVGGTQLREGINVYRFANRIPLLFEAGADVVTQVATKRINWASYHMDSKKDAIGVYVSIVSTRIPFKGTSKEYVGDDVKEIQASVRRALQGCCQQLRVNLAKSIAQREEKERRKTLVRYIPSIATCLMTVLEKMRVKDELLVTAGSKRKVDGDDEASTVRKHGRMFARLKDGSVSEDSLTALLTKGVDKFELDATLHASFTEGGGADELSVAGGAPRVRLLLVPTTLQVRDFPVPGGNADADSLTQVDRCESVNESPSKWTSLSQMSDISLSQATQQQQQQQDTGSIFDLTAEDLQPLQRVSRKTSSGSKVTNNAKDSSRNSKTTIVQPRWLKLIDNSVVGVDEKASEIPGYIMIC